MTVALVAVRLSAYRDATCRRSVGGGFGTPFIRYMAELTGKTRPKLLYLPTASADSARLAVAGPAAVVRPEPPPIEDPFPIRRVRAADDEAQLDA